MSSVVDQAVGRRGNKPGVALVRHKRSAALFSNKGIQFHAQINISALWVAMPGCLDHFIGSVVSTVLAVSGLSDSYSQELVCNTGGFSVARFRV